MTCDVAADEVMWVGDAATTTNQMQSKTEREKKTGRADIQAAFKTTPLPNLKTDKKRTRREPASKMTNFYD